MNSLDTRFNRVASAQVQGRNVETGGGIREDDEYLDDLPASVREIADVIGRRSALRLIGRLPACLAGKEGKQSSRVVLYVPKRLTQDHRLVRIIGWDAASRLVSAFGGEIMQPANCRAVFARHRDEAIVRMLNEGARPGMVASIMGVSRRHVHKVQCAIPQEESGLNVQENGDVLIMK